jgi:hypothetical protein
VGFNTTLRSQNSRHCLSAAMRSSRPFSRAASWSSVRGAAGDPLLIGSWGSAADPERREAVPKSGSGETSGRVNLVSLPITSWGYS